MNLAELRHATGAELRRCAREGHLTTPTSGLAAGFVQTNLVVLPKSLAFDFLLFCQRNPKPCPLLDVTEAGCPEPKLAAPGADLRTDLPRYAVYVHGELIETPTDLTAWWREDMVAFLLGCSFSFEHAMLRAGLPVRHIEQGCNVPMYLTSLPCKPAGVFHGNMVVSMRPLTAEQAIRAVQISGRFPFAHGAPVHWGDPAVIGIKDIARPQFGDPVAIQPGEIPVFWACGVTPQAAIMAAKPPLALTHSPGHMFVTDWQEADLER
jgi:uncharacterized protein YcsI (UPF0317 family)